MCTVWKTQVTFTFCLIFQDNPGHDRISATVCNEIISNPDSFNLKLWVKILNQVELSSDNDANVKELVVLAEQMLDVSVTIQIVL